MCSSYSSTGILLKVSRPRSLSAVLLNFEFLVPGPRFLFSTVCYGVKTLICGDFLDGGRLRLTHCCTRQAVDTQGRERQDWEQASLIVLRLDYSWTLAPRHELSISLVSGRHLSCNKHILENFKYEPMSCDVFKATRLRLRTGTWFYLSSCAVRCLLPEKRSAGDLSIGFACDNGVHHT